MTHFAQWVNEYFVCIDFHTALGFATISFNKTCVSLLISLQCCYHNDIVTVITFSFSKQGELMARGMDFGNLSWENTRPLRACVYASIRQRFRTVHATGYRSAQEKA